ncbi:MAG TPA: histidine kinase dimerization/phosphoacceptor domain -containing protein [Puia sp.]|nr:histidine kinase dimerization/phosphoacceptor domain -containing protein [Puia sp.]
MIRHLTLVLYACCCFLRGNAQNGDRAARDRTILELDAAAIYVRSDATVPLDTALLISSAHLGLNRIDVIAEGFDAVFCDRYGGWINTGNVDSFIRILPNLGSSDQVKAKWLIGAWYAFQPGASNYRKAVEFLSQTKEVEKRAGDPEIEAQSDCLLSKAYYMLGDTINGNRCYFAVIDNPSFSQLTAIQAKARNYVGIYAPFTPQMAKFRMDCLTSALDQYRQLRDTGNQVNTLMDIAYQRFAAGDANGSQDAALQCLGLEKAWRYPWTQHTNDLLAYLRGFLGDLAGALQYAMAELAAVDRTNDKFLQPHMYLRIAWTYAALDNLEASTDWNKRALHAAIEKDDIDVIYRVLEVATIKQLHLDLDLPNLNLLRDLLKKKPPVNLGAMQVADLALGNSYARLNDYPTARRYYLAALKLDEQVSVMKGGMKSAYSLEKVGWINLKLGEYATSRKYLMALMSPPYEKVMTKQELYAAYEDIQRVDSALGDYPSAYHYMMLAKRLSEKIFSEAQTKQLIDLNVKYQTLQREKQLQASEAKRQLEAQKDANTRKLFYGGFALLGLLITMVTIRYYNNKRKNRQLREQKQEIDAQNEILHELNDKQTVLLEEKEWLLREIHHRVKNNLQIIASLLSAQSEFVNDQTAIKVIADSQSRVKAMSLIHQKLYNSENLSTIDMAEYIGDLVAYLRDSLDQRRRVIFNLDIAKIRLDVSKAVPLGLILNESITNAFKYAFAEGDDARISIRLTATAVITLEISDNGRGLAARFSGSESNSFGMILMKGMAEDLEGNFTIQSGPGTKITVSFTNSAIKVA